MFQSLRAGFLAFATMMVTCIAPAAPTIAQTAKTQLQVYTTLLPESLAEFKSAFEAENPNIEIVWRRESTGTLTARIIAESENARGDVIWGLAVTSMLDFKRRGILEPYAPKNLAALRPLFRDAESVPHWIGMEAWVAAICFNTIEAQKQNLPRPESWFDLEPRLQGQDCLLRPGRLGHRLFPRLRLPPAFREAKAWEFMEGLHKNIAVYEPSGTRPCRHAATGEYRSVSPMSSRA